MFVKVVFLSCLIGLTFGSLYNLGTSGELTCILRQNGTGPCNKWIFNVSTAYHGFSCFPAQTKVMTEAGLKRMDEVKKNDLILGFKDGKEVFTAVTSWFHKIHDQSSEYLRISVEDGEF